MSDMKTSLYYYFSSLCSVYRDHDGSSMLSLSGEWILADVETYVHNVLNEEGTPLSCQQWRNRYRYRWFLVWCNVVCVLFQEQHVTQLWYINHMWWRWYDSKQQCNVGKWHALVDNILPHFEEAVKLAEDVHVLLPAQGSDVCWYKHILCFFPKQ